MGSSPDAGHAVCPSVIAAMAMRPRAAGGKRCPSMVNRPALWRVVGTRNETVESRLAGPSGSGS